jgi:hypothetical protein
MNEKITRYVYYFGLTVVAIGLPVSVFLMSLGQFIILGSLLFNGRLLEKLKRFGKNKAAVVLGSIFLMHLVGLLYTSDFNYGFNDIRIKAPLLLFPLFMASWDPIPQKIFNWILAAFVGAVMVGTFISMGVYYGIIPAKIPGNDIRNISIFISHIRFSMMIALAIFICAYYAWQEEFLIRKIAMLVLIAWLLFFLVFLNALTGIVASVIVVFVLMFYEIFNLKNRSLKIIPLIAMALLFLALFFYLKPLIQVNMAVHPNEIPKPEPLTALGNAYHFDTTAIEQVNGYALWMYDNQEEMEQAWKERSKMSLGDPNTHGAGIRYVLMRYLTSKGLHKDAAGVNALGQDEIRLIENGVSNANYAGRSKMTIRILQTLSEFRNYQLGGNPNGKSMVMRFEFWKAALAIIQKHPVIGVGTGDVRKAFDAQYELSHSPLSLEHRLRAHNQFLSITIAFGVTGLLWFIVSLIYPMVKTGMSFHYFSAVFFIIFVVSLFTEDTLESQAGVTFYTFFNSLFLFRAYQKPE